MLPMCKLVWSNLTTKCLSTKRNILNCPNRLIKKWTAKFVKSGVPEPELSAKYIISHVVNQGDEVWRQFIIILSISIKCERLIIYFITSQL